MAKTLEFWALNFLLIRNNPNLESKAPTSQPPPATSKTLASLGQTDTKRMANHGESIFGIKGTLAVCEDEVSPARFPWLQLRLQPSCTSTIAAFMVLECSQICWPKFKSAAVLYCFLSLASSSLTQSCRYARYSILCIS